MVLRAAAAPTASSSTTRSARRSTSGATDPDLLAFGAVDGDLDYYFIDGPTPEARRRSATRSSPAASRCRRAGPSATTSRRYSYYPESKVRNSSADNFRQRARSPRDVLWLDIHYEDGYKPFTWDRERFPIPRGWCATCGRRASTSCRSSIPIPKEQPGWALYDTRPGRGPLREEPGRLRLRGAGLAVARRRRIPGPSVFPTSRKPAAREWWGGLLKDRTSDVGVAGIWNDMNEPAVFVEPTHTDAASTCATTTRDSPPTSARSTTSTAC